MAPAPLLIVEDDDAVAALFAEVLEDAGYRVERVPAPDQARALLASHGPKAFSLVLSNPFAPTNGDPYTWLDHLRALTSAPIVIGTGRPAALYADHQARGFAALLSHPFDVDALVALVTGLVPPAGGPAGGTGSASDPTGSAPGR